MPNLGENFVGSLVGLNVYPQGFANKHLGRTEPGQWIGTLVTRDGAT